MQEICKFSLRVFELIFPKSIVELNILILKPYNFRIFNTDLRNFMATNSSKQPSKRTESTTKKFVRFSLLSRKFTLLWINIWSRNTSWSFLPCHLFIYSFRVEHGYPGYPTRLSGISDTDVIISWFEHDLRLHAML